MVTYNCTTANFASNWALRAAGDVYNLADGDYGTLTLFTATYSPRITIQADNRHGAEMQVTISGAGLASVSGYNFIDLDLGENPDFHEPGGSANLTFEWCKSSGYFRCDFSSDIIMQSCYHYGRMAFSDSDSILFDECCIHYFGGDGLNFYRSDNVTVRNCVFYDAWAPSDPEDDVHPDAMQSLDATNTLIRGNIIIDDPATVINPANSRQLQGIFMGDGIHTNCHIEQNMISVGNGNGIRLTRCDGTSYIRGNSLIGCQVIINQTIQASVPVEDNIALGFLNETADGKMALSNNLNYTLATEGFVDPTGLDWTKFETVPAHSTKGAAARYAEVLAGTNVEAINLLRDVGGVTSFTAPGGGTPPAVSKKPASFGNTVLHLGGSPLIF